MAKLSGLQPGMNQTVDFIFYDTNGNVLMAENDKISNKDKLALIGTFAKIKKNYDPLTVDEATDRALNKLTTLGITGINKENLNLEEIIINNNKFFDIIGDKRLKEEPCITETCDAKTQVFSILVNDEDKEKFVTGGANWVDWKQEENIFPDHYSILNKWNNTRSISGGRRTRKHKKGKKSKKTKKSMKGKKGKKSKKTYKRRH
jgi:hypothetical protein